MTKKKDIPDITEILRMVDDRMKYAIKHPAGAKEKAMNDIYENEDRINNSVYRDFTTITLGDYIGAAHAFNREMMSPSMDTEQRAAYFTLFAFEERAKRIQEHYSYVQ
tara:strand:- start:1907 stop:2230 length:324 start_codon:yes stop_codon:yes gene_type:complete